MAFKTEAQRCKGFSSLFAPLPTYQIRTPLNVLQERENNNQKKQSVPVSFEKESSKKIICENTPLTLKAHSWERAKKKKRPDQFMMANDGKCRRTQIKVDKNIRRPVSSTGL